MRYFAVALVLIFSVFIIGCKNTKVEKNDLPNRVKIAVIGGSISAGYNPDFSRDKGTYGWVNMLNGETGPENTRSEKTLYSIWNNFEIENYAVAGSTLNWWNNLERLDKIFRYSPDIVIVYLGANDIFAYLDDGIFSNDEEKEFYNNYNEILTKLEKNIPAAKIILIDYWDILDGKSSYIKDEALKKKYSGLSEYVKKINNDTIMPLSANRELVKVYDAFYGHCYGRYLDSQSFTQPSYVWGDLEKYDIHPNTEGHKKLAALIYEKLLEMKGKYIID